MTDVSVVIPFRGRWDSLLPLLNALKRQTLGNRLEIVLSVDGEEKPPERISRMVHQVVTGSSKGPAAARNRGWRSSESPLILFTDGDCVPEDTWAEAMLKGFRGEFQAVKGVYSEGGGRLIQRLAQLEFAERYRIMGRREGIFLADTYSAGFQREWLEKLGGFDETFPFPEHEDVDLSWRLVRKGGRIGFVPAARVSHSHRPTWLRYFALKMRRGKWRMMLIREFPEMAVSDGYTPQTMKLQIVLIPFILPSVILFFTSGVHWAAPVVLFLVSTLPMWAVAIRNDALLIPLVPFFCLFRAAALFTGTLAGVFRRRHTCSHP